MDHFNRFSIALKALSQWVEPLRLWVEPSAWVQPSAWV